MIHPSVAQHLPAIRRLCGEFGVLRLDVFGSATTAAFDLGRSDVDFLVTYPDDYDWGPFGGRIWDLQAALATTLGRDVDLVMNHAGLSPTIRQSIEQHAEEVYVDEGLAKTA